MPVDDGSPAFPGMAYVQEFNTNTGESKWIQMQRPGMSLRDWFAGMAMGAMFNGFAPGSESAPAVYTVCAREAYALAEAMLKARNA